jgi:hypothetical protein
MIPDLLLTLASVAVLLSPLFIDVVIREPRDRRDSRDSTFNGHLN